MAIVIPYARQTWVDGSGGGTPESAARLAVIEDSLVAASQPPAVRVFNNAAQLILDNTLTALSFNSERFDQAGGSASTMHDAVTNNSRLTCRYAGVYQITGHVQWDSVGGAGTYELFIRLNGTTQVGIATLDGVDAAVTIAHRQQASTLYLLAVNDYVELMVRQITTASRNVAVLGNYSPEFMMSRVG